MPRDLFARVDRHLEDLFGPDDPVLTAVVTSAESAGLPAIQVSPGQGRLLHLLTRLVGARRVLELGTLAGYSAIWMARALPEDGRLVTLERDPRHAEVARANLAAAGLAGRVEVRVGDALDTLAALAAEGATPFDLAFVDADKEGYPAYLRAVLPLLRSGALLVADNVVRAGRILDPAADDTASRGAAEFLRALAEEPRVEACALQVVGAKGHDGLALARVR